MRMMLAAAVVAAISTVAASAPSTAFAQGISVGPGGVRIETRRERGWERRPPRRGWERSAERCRTIIERRRNRFGELVTRRTRVCR